MSNSTFMPDVIIDGIDEVIANVAQLEAKAQFRILRSGLRGALKVVAKRMKSDLSPKVKVARKWVGHKIKGRKKLSAKVGFGVGRKLSDMATIVPKNRPKNKPGVGISAINVHWWIVGTSRRKRLNNASTGQMPAFQPGLAEKAAAAVQAEAFQAAVKAAKTQVDKEVKKLLKGK